ncbi:MAG: DMT family transporter [Pseudomonadota bacterium]
MGMRLSDHGVGVVFVLISALVFSSAGLFVKGVSSDAWSIIFWRGLSAAVITVAYCTWRRSLRREFLQMGRPGLVAGLVGASGTIAFIPSFKYTTIANVSLIYAAAPFASAAIAWLWLKEKPTRTILVASTVAFCGVLLIVGGSLGSLNLTGDALALWMTLVMAVFMCIYRRYPETPAAGPSVVLSLSLLPVGWLLGDPLAASLKEIAIMATFGLVFAVASIALAEGARRLPAPETALISALETPLAPVLAYVVFTEVPAVLTVIGGTVIFAAVLYSQTRVAPRAKPDPSAVPRCADEGHSA